MSTATGRGPGPITADGCAVDMYTLLPARGEPEIVHGVVRTGGTILDLGSGTGRVADPLVELGHPVVAVDESAEMLSHVRRAETVRSTIDRLDLDRRFDGVLLASHLVNEPADETILAILSTAARHLAPGGVVVIEWHPPEWFDVATDGEGTVGAVRVGLRDVWRDGDLLHAVATYAADDRRWEQSFTARQRSEVQLESALAAVGLTFDRWLSDDHRWLAATAADG